MLVGSLQCNKRGSYKFSDLLQPCRKCPEWRWSLFLHHCDIRLTCSRPRPCNESTLGLPHFVLSGLGMRIVPQNVSEISSTIAQRLHSRRSKSHQLACRSSPDSDAAFSLPRGDSTSLHILEAQQQFPLEGAWRHKLIYFTMSVCGSGERFLPQAEAVPASL